MKVKKYKSNKLVSISLKKYAIDWEKAPSKGQRVLQDFLYQFWHNQLILGEMRIPGTLWRFDIVNCNKRIIFEFSPIHHFAFNKFFHKNRAGYLKSLKSDVLKQKWAEENDFKVIEITDEDLPKLSLKYIEEKFGVSIL